MADTRKRLNSKGSAGRNSRGCSQVVAVAAAVAAAAGGFAVVLASEWAGQCEGQTGFHHQREKRWSTGCTDFAERAQGEVGEVAATSGVRW